MTKDETVTRPSFSFYGRRLRLSPSLGWRHGAIELAADGVEKVGEPRSGRGNTFAAIVPMSHVNDARDAARENR